MPGTIPTKHPTHTKHAVHTSKGTKKGGAGAHRVRRGGSHAVTVTKR